MNSVGILLSLACLTYFTGKALGGNTVYILSITTIVVLLIFTTLPIFKDVRSLMPDSLPWITTVAAALIGIFLAHQYNEDKQVSKEKLAKIEKIGKIKAEIEIIKSQLQMTYETVYHESNGQNSQFLIKYPLGKITHTLPSPKYFDNLMTQEGGLDIVHKTSIGMMTKVNNDIKSSLVLLQTHQFSSLENFKDLVDFTILYCTYAIACLSLQEEFWQGKISDTEIDIKRRELSYTHFRDFRNKENTTIRAIPIYPQERHYPYDLNNLIVLVGSLIIRKVEEIKKKESITTKEIYLRLHSQTNASEIIPGLIEYLKLRGYDATFSNTHKLDTPGTNEMITFAYNKQQIYVVLGILE